MNDFFTWSLLGSYSGAILAVTLITQFVKGLGPIDRIPTRFVSWIIAVVVLILAQLFTAQLTWSTGVMTLLNAVVVSLASNGTYDACTKL
ncbi:MAG: hypothetical protein IJU05_04860 [Schwartzia sp.]|nr:hypothetical protein [Schwartzia sp. (in: firmicutes)]